MLPVAELQVVGTIATVVGKDGDESKYMQCTVQYLNDRATAAQFSVVVSNVARRHAGNFFSIHGS